MVDKVIKKVVSETVSNELANHLVVDAIFNNILRDMIVKKTEYPDNNQALINHTAKGAPNHQPINEHSLESRIIRDGGNSSPTKHLKNRHSLSITKIQNIELLPEYPSERSNFKSRVMFNPVRKESPKSKSFHKAFLNRSMKARVNSSLLQHETIKKLSSSFKRKPSQANMLSDSLRITA